MKQEPGQCEVCDGSEWRRVKTTMPGPTVDICKRCLCVYSLSDVPPATGVCSSPPEETRRSFAGYDPSKYLNSGYHKVIRNHIPLGGASLDIGCFDGAFPAYLKTLGFDAYGLELQADMAAFCRDNGLPVYPGAFPHDVPEQIACRKYDFISALECTCYWTDFNLCASRLHDMLNDGGRFLVKLMQGTSHYYDGRHAYSERVHNFRALLNVDAFKVLMTRHGFDCVSATPFAYIFDRRRYHPNRALRHMYGNWIRARSAWAALTWPARKWDKVVMVFRRR